MPMCIRGRYGHTSHTVCLDQNASTAFIRTNISAHQKALVSLLRPKPLKRRLGPLSMSGQGGISQENNFTRCTMYLGRERVSLRSVL